MNPKPPKVIVIEKDGQTHFQSEGEGPSIPDLERLARWMDSLFSIPSIGLRFGLDSILGLIPGVGDTAASAVSLYILHAASRRGVSRLTMTRMALNIALDTIAGSIPVIGDVFDVYWKANQKNVELLKRHALASPSEEKRLRWADWLFLGALVAVLITLLVGSVTIAVMLVAWLGSAIATNIPPAAKV